MVLLTNLPYDTDIHYETVYIPGEPTFIAQFHTRPLKPKPTLRFIASADVGDPVSKNYTAIPQMALACAAARGTEDAFDLAVHVGDIAYNLDIPAAAGNYLHGIQDMGSTFPWMVAPGNHESDCNYT